jgi:4-oxalocrotonate tautomerase
LPEETMPIVDITLIEGRSPDAKKKLMKAVTDAIEHAIDAPRPSIRVIIHEVPAAHFSVGGEPKG